MSFSIKQKNTNFYKQKKKIKKIKKMNFKYIILLSFLVSFTIAEKKCVWEFKAASFFGTCANGLVTCEYYNSLEEAKAECL